MILTAHPDDESMFIIEIQIIILKVFYPYNK